MRIRSPASGFIGVLEVFLAKKRCYISGTGRLSQSFLVCSFTSRVFTLGFWASRTFLSFSFNFPSSTWGVKAMSWILQHFNRVFKPYHSVTSSKTLNWYNKTLKLSRRFRTEFSSASKQSRNYKIKSKKAVNPEQNAQTLTVSYTT